MALPKLPQRCDVAVIGAGVGGLTAAALLAKAGMSVVVLERESRPGGYLAGFHRKAFVFDSAIHWLNQCNPGGMVHKVFHYLGDDPPPAPPLTRIRRYQSESFNYLLSNQPDELKEQLAKDFPEDRDGLERFFQTAHVLGSRMSSYAHYMRSLDTMKWYEKMGRGLSLAGWSFPFWRWTADRDCAALSHFFKSEGLKSIFCSEENILSCLVPIGWAYEGDFQRPPKGGSQSFIKWLIKGINAAGSIVSLRSEVQTIGVDNRGVSSVKLTDGREVACNWVIAACDVDMLFQKMLPQGTIPADTVQKYSKAELYNSCVTLSLGLSRDPRTWGFDEEMVFLTTDKATRAQHNSGDPHLAGLSILAPSIRDPSMAPEGKGTMTVYTEANIAYGDHWKTGPGLTRGDAYRDFKRQYAEVIIDRLEKTLAPGLKSSIEVMDVATPVTHLRYTGNRDGTIMAQRTTKANMKAKVVGYRTPVNRLLIGGHWAELGGGVPMAVRAGSNAAGLVLQKEKPSDFKRLNQVLDG